MSTQASLSYHEPNVLTILILSSFLLLVNLANHLLNHFLYCGLVGQILVGVAWGTPGTDWLSSEAQNTMMQLGYLGLLLLVYEGGLRTDVKTLRANLMLSAAVAAVGIGAPVGLSFILCGVLSITPLQAFAAGAALCSTSLGTTFTILQTSGLSQSRLGVVLTSAAMMDDVVGLVMVQVISNLGRSSSDIGAATVIRPIGVSIAFAVLLPVLCVYVVKPLAIRASDAVGHSLPAKVQHLLVSGHTDLLLHTAFLLAMVTGSSYAGTSNLFAAYLAGATVTWLDSLQPAVPTDSMELETMRSHGPASKPAPHHAADTDITPRRKNTASLDMKSPAKIVEQVAQTGMNVYQSYFAAAVECILIPFFFASIGFSIPITRMFSGDVVWRGLVYSALMVFGKLLCGLCVMHFAVPVLGPKRLRNLLPLLPSSGLHWRSFLTKSPRQYKAAKSGNSTAYSKQERPSPGHVSAQPNGTRTRSKAPSPQTTARKTASGARNEPLKPRSLYPAAILGTAMVARGEIGFLISSVAESEGIYGGGDTGGSSELYLVVTWAVLICTVLGPICVGLLVKRVRRMQEVERTKKTGREDPLGLWGISGM
ncbi:hypothetical protein BAUCODRAFT_62064 [Baudoinia panamericana UAMH 10762]|uniref:Cation/H+ exchanger transmembrane domain-containing protein n=1 Tax=Baudoinia panamericana (strain UAMH 10762) TaxID=717646 RepID=M2NNZ1_BAUPA|nr:uncharacterized protein BAUCODRAFT_62064 [Baudoinia panamericana UAMH 10762]EMD00956.1 hypothetical protein BAUCODRAFT_62064 [Baudoinia panamericana UAMH 10762]